MSNKIIDDNRWIKEPCKHPEHNPPNMIVIPAGKILEHICPTCGKKSYIRSNSPMM